MVKSQREIKILAISGQFLMQQDYTNITDTLMTYFTQILES